MKANREISAIIISVVVFIILHLSLTAGTNYYLNTAEKINNSLLLVNIASYSLYVFSGFLSGIISRKAFLIVGSVTGIFSSVLIILFFGVASSETFGKLVLVLIGAISGLIGGAISMYVTRHKLNAL